MDLEDELLFVILLYLYVKLKSARRQRIREETSALGEHAYTQALLGRSDTQCQESMQISHEAYVLLCNHFKQRKWLQDGEQINVEEKIAMFLTMIGHNEQLRNVKQRFKHSRKTIFECFYEVLQGMIKFAIEEFKKEVVAPTSSDATSNMSNRYKNLREIFSGAIGALDGTLIPAIVPANEEFLYKRRGGSQCYQNVLAVCDFNMIFTFVWAGWEAVHDSRVLKEVIFNDTANFPVPSPNNYYLCDAEYDNTRGFLAPYCNKRFRRANFRSACSTTKQKRFNHVHSQLRNVIERAFGVLKARFPVLKQMINLPFSKQRDVVIACFTIHNFIRRHNIHDQLFMECDENTELADEEQYGKSGEPRLDGSHWDVQDMHYMFNLREEITNQLVANGST